MTLGVLLLAGVLDLSHGFCVLLAILTALRTSAAETCSALRPALVGTLLGVAWAQGLFTLVIAPVFAQISPVDWRLAEARVLDVLVGAAVGVLTTRRWRWSRRVPALPTRSRGPTQPAGSPRRRTALPE